MSERARHLFVLVLVSVLVIGSLLVAVGIPGVVKPQKTRLGLDLQGGTQLIFQARTPSGKPVNATTLTDAVNILRQRVNQIGTSGITVQPIGNNEIQVDLPNVSNPAAAERIVGVTGQLYFYDWEASVIAPNGQIAGPNNQNVTGGTSAGTPQFGITQYAAVLRAAKRPAVPQCTASQAAKARGCYPIESAPTGEYYYVDAKTQSVYAPLGPEPTLALLQSDLAQKHVKLPAGAHPVFVKPGTVLVQASTGPEVPVPNDFYVLADNVKLTGHDISNPIVTQDPTQGVAVSFGFKGSGAHVFTAVTAVLATRGFNNSLAGGTPNVQHFAVSLDGVLVTVPQIDFNANPNGIDASNGSEITGSFTFASATTLANVLASGALPVKLHEISSSLITATLGRQALNQGLVAGIVGLILVALFLFVFYRVLGVIAVAALAIYALYFFAIIKLVPVTLTLPGIAGLILTIGVAADANVVIFERVKEESRAGRSPMNAITAGYRRGLAAIIDANAVTFMAAFILFILSQSDVQGFALTLGIGVLVSFFTAIAATRAILSTLGHSRAISSQGALGVTQSRRRWTFDFMGNSRWFFSLSGTILLIGALAIGGRGINFGIDFVSGTKVQVTVEKQATVNQVSAAIDGLHLVGSDGKAIGPAVVQQVSSVKRTKTAAGTSSFEISTKTLTAHEIGGDVGSAPTTIYGALAAHFGVQNKSFVFTTVGPTFGQTIANSAAVAIIASLLAIAAYIALRFQWKYAVPAMIALAHDILITSGVYALTGRQVTASTVAALLTILGYSLYDTIIVFDRVRENVQKMQNAAFSQIVNRSMSEVLTRSLATSLCTLLPVVTLLIFGGSTLKDFAFALLVGVASGAYSSIFIASPVLTHWKEREPIYRRRRARIAAEHDGVVPAYATAGSAARETEVVETRRSRRRLTQPARPDGSISTGEFRDLVRDLHGEPLAGGRKVVAPKPTPAPPPKRDPTADARPEDVVMPGEDAASRRRGASRSRGRRKGRPR